MTSMAPRRWSTLTGSATDGRTVSTTHAIPLSVKMAVKAANVLAAANRTTANLLLVEWTNVGNRLASRSCPDVGMFCAPTGMTVKQSSSCCAIAGS